MCARSRKAPHRPMHQGNMKSDLLPTSSSKQEKVKNMVYRWWRLDLAFGVKCCCCRLEAEEVELNKVRKRLRQRWLYCDTSLCRCLTKCAAMLVNVVIVLTCGGHGVACRPRHCLPFRLATDNTALEEVQGCRRPSHPDDSKETNRAG